MTTAITPNAKGHDKLGAMDSRFVEPHEMPWEETKFPGIYAKTLLVDRETGLLTTLMKMDPGATLPDHEHVGIEQTFVIEGSLVDPEGECTAGNFVWRPAGTRHAASTPNGALVLAIFQVPNKFFTDQGEKDMLDRDWQEFWGEAGNLSAQG